MSLTALPREGNSARGRARATPEASVNERKRRVGGQPARREAPRSAAATGWLWIGRPASRRGGAKAKGSSSRVPEPVGGIEGAKCGCCKEEPGRGRGRGALWDGPQRGGGAPKEAGPREEQPASLH